MTPDELPDFNVDLENNAGGEGKTEKPSENRRTSKAGSALGSILVKTRWSMRSEPDMKRWSTARGNSVNTVLPLPPSPAVDK